MPRSGDVLTLRLPGWLIGLSIVVVFTFFAAVGAAVAASQVESEVRVNRANGFRTRALACLNLVVDDDRYFTLPEDCAHPLTVEHYPAEVCAREEGLCG